jgi:RecG-like helicase
MGLFRKKTAGEVREEHLQSAIESHDQAVRIADLQPRERVEIVGRVEHVCKTTLDGTPAFEIEVSDGTGSVVALWTGRSSIACVEYGRCIALWGRAAPMRREHSLVVYNPRYELLP